MKKMKYLLGLLCIGAVATNASAISYKVICDKAFNGTYSVSPAPNAEGEYPEGTVLTITAKPAKGYMIDCSYYALPGSWGLMYYESMATTCQATVRKNMHIGASFIKQSELVNIKVIQDVVYAKPGVKALKYDVYEPKGAKNLPCVVIVHGGGWTTNNEDIMRGLARELAKTGKYVVFSIDYRWLGKLDGDSVPNRYCDLIEDVYGAIAHIMEHARHYGADPSRVLLTGDSAGGHLVAAATNLCEKIGDKGFGQTPGIYEFMPSYIPENKTVSQVRDEITKAIKAVAPSYGVFTEKPLASFPTNPDKNEADIRAITPIENIPLVNEREVPQLLLRGTYDPLIKDEDVNTYVKALTKAGQRVEYIQVGGASHAFFDWKPNSDTKNVFSQYGVFYASEMSHFFDSVLKRTDN